MRFTVPAYGRPELQGASWVRAESEELPCPVLLRLALGSDGRLIATGLLLEMEDRELTTRAARINVAEIVAAFAAGVSKMSVYKRLARELHARERSDVEDAWQPDLCEMPWLEFIAVPAAGPNAGRHIPVPRSRPGRRGYGDDHWRMVARAYRNAKRRHPRRHIRALMDELHIAEPTAHRWIKTARAKGFIPEEDSR